MRKAVSTLLFCAVMAAAPMAFAQEKSNEFHGDAAVNYFPSKVRAQINSPHDSVRQNYRSFIVSIFVPHRSAGIYVSTEKARAQQITSNSASADKFKSKLFGIGGRYTLKNGTKLTLGFHGFRYMDSDRTAGTLTANLKFVRASASRTWRREGFPLTFTGEIGLGLAGRAKVATKSLNYKTGAGEYDYDLRLGYPIRDNGLALNLGYRSMNFRLNRGTAGGFTFAKNTTKVRGVYLGASYDY